MSRGRSWTHAAGIIWPLLVDAGENGRTITYEALAVSIATNPLSVRYALQPIQDYCLENRLAPLTVVAVGKHSGVPGDGFVAWDTKDLPSARTAVVAQNWDLVGNPFSGFGPEEDETSLARELLAQPAKRGAIYRQVRDRGIAQRIFRLALLEAYQGCAFCSLSFPAALEAAHILPWRHCTADEKMDVTNGLLLCASHHRLFDDGSLFLTEKLTIGYYDPEANDGAYSAADRTFAWALNSAPRFRRLGPFAQIPHLCADASRSTDGILLDAG